MKHRSYSLLGNIAVVNFPEGMKLKEKKVFAKKIMEENKSVKTVLEKSGNFKGRLRKQETGFILGERTKEVLYKENGCIFRFNIDETYFSPRLSNERKEVASLIKKNEEVLVAFAGVGPFTIVIAKNSKAKKVYSNEINRKANEYAKENIKRNKVEKIVELIPGDFKRVAKELSLRNKKFDVIVMARPQLKDLFLKEAFMLSKKKTRIYFYDFCSVEKTSERVKMIEELSHQLGKKIKITNVKEAGEIAPYKVRIRIDFEVRN